MTYPLRGAGYSKRKEKKSKLLRRAVERWESKILRTSKPVKHFRWLSNLSFANSEASVFDICKCVSCTVWQAIAPKMVENSAKDWFGNRENCFKESVRVFATSWDLRTTSRFSKVSSASLPLLKMPAYVTKCCCMKSLNVESKWRSPNPNRWHLFKIDSMDGLRSTCLVLGRKIKISWISLRLMMGVG